MKTNVNVNVQNYVAEDILGLTERQAVSVMEHIVFEMKQQAQASDLLNHRMYLFTRCTCGKAKVIKAVVKRLLRRIQTSRYGLG